MSSRPSISSSPPPLSVSPSHGNSRLSAGSPSYSSMRSSSSAASASSASIRYSVSTSPRRTSSISSNPSSSSSSSLLSPPEQPQPRASSPYRSCSPSFFSGPWDRNWHPSWLTYPNTKQQFDPELVLTDLQVHFIKKAFADLDKDNLGYIKHSDLKRVLLEMSNDSSDEDANELLREMDLEKRSVVRWPEFLFCMSNWIKQESRTRDL